MVNAMIPQITNNILHLSKSLAALDAILMQDWELRYYSHNSNWSYREEMGSMRTGSGDHYYILFNSSGIVIKGFCKNIHSETQFIKINALYDEMPACFTESFLKEPAFQTGLVTFVLWKLNDETQWTIRQSSCASAGECAKSLLMILEGNPFTYKSWAEKYYERNIIIDTVIDIYKHVPVTEVLAKRLNPNTNTMLLKTDLHEIGYPCVL
jgi:hypothetical protein